MYQSFKINLKNGDILPNKIGFPLKVNMHEYLF